jgi:hypothetical protein
MAVKIVQTEGIAGFTKGISAAFAFEQVISVIRLGLYEPLKSLLGANDPHNTPFSTKLFAGMTLGVLSSVSSPFDLVKVRMQAWDKPT